MMKLRFDRFMCFYSSFLSHPPHRHRFSLCQCSSFFFYLNFFLLFDLFYYVSFVGTFPSPHRAPYLPVGVPSEFSCFMFSGARKYTFGLLTSMYKICTYINIFVVVATAVAAVVICFSCTLFVCADADSTIALEHVLNSYKQALLALSRSRHVSPFLFSHKSKTLK